MAVVREMGQDQHASRGRMRPRTVVLDHGEGRWVDGEKDDGAAVFNARPAGAPELPGAAFVGVQAGGKEVGAGRFGRFRTRMNGVMGELAGMGQKLARSKVLDERIASKAIGTQIRCYVSHDDKLTLEYTGFMGQNERATRLPRFFRPMSAYLRA